MPSSPSMTPGPLPSASAAPRRGRGRRPCPRALAPRGGAPLSGLPRSARCPGRGAAGLAGARAPLRAVLPGALLAVSRRPARRLATRAPPRSRAGAGAGPALCSAPPYSVAAGVFSPPLHPRPSGLRGFGPLPLGRGVGACPGTTGAPLLPPDPARPPPPPRWLAAPRLAPGVPAPWAVASAVPARPPSSRSRALALPPRSWPPCPRPGLVPRWQGRRPVPRPLQPPPMPAFGRPPRRSVGGALASDARHSARLVALLPLPLIVAAAAFSPRPRGASLRASRQRLRSPRIGGCPSRAPGDRQRAARGRAPGRLAPVRRPLCARVPRRSPRLAPGASARRAVLPPRRRVCRSPRRRYRVGPPWSHHAGRPTPPGEAPGAPRPARQKVRTPGPPLSPDCRRFARPLSPA